MTAEVVAGESVLNLTPDQLVAGQLDGSSPAKLALAVMGVESVPLAVDSVTAEWADRTHEVFRLWRDPDTYEVRVESDVTLTDYYEHMQPETRDQDFGLMIGEGEQLQGRTVVRIGATHEGGGVAMMAPAFIHLLRLQGVDAHWFTMNPNPAAFDVTKKIHNGSQDMPGADGKVPVLTEADKPVHQAWNAENFEVLSQQESVQTADIIMIDDPQPAPLIRLLKQLNPHAKIIFRNHIQTDRQKMATPGTPQHIVHNYLWNECGVSEADAYIVHPVQSPDGTWQFAPSEVRDSRIAPIPATSDPFDDQNRELTDQEVEQGLAAVNAQLAADGQPPLSRNKPRGAELARFDPGKGMHLAMEIWALTAEILQVQGISMDPELLLAGNGSKDDPDGQWMRARIMEAREKIYGDKDMRVVRLRHDYVAMNALLRRRQVETGPPVPEFLVHPAEGEGWEDRISVAIKKGVPVIVFNLGGPPYQVVEGRSGFILDYNAPGHDLKRGAAIIAYYITHPEEYAKLVETTLEEGAKFNAREFGSTANTTRLMIAFNNLLAGRSMDSRWRMSEFAQAA